MERYWLNFVEEYWPGQLPNTVIARIEVYDTLSEREFADEEIRVGTSDVDRYNRLVEHWDWAEVTEYHIEWLKKYVEDMNEKNRRN